MRKRTKAVIAIVASICCVLISAGVAYGTIMSAEEHEAQMVIDDDATSMDVEEGLSESRLSFLKELEVCGHDADGNEIADAGNLEQSPNGSSTAAANSGNGGVMGSSSPAPCTLSMLGNTISYVASFNTASAPASTAGLWSGSDSTTDGSWAYFIGHHPGVFNCVMDLRNGDAVQVCDSAGNMRTYHVIAIYDIPDETQWEQIAADVESHGESITLQTCCGDHQHYRIVEAV